MPEETVLELPFVYDMTYLAPGGRKTRVTRVRDAVPVAVRTVDPVDAPIAFAFDGVEHRTVDGLCLSRPSGAGFLNDLVSGRRNAVTSPEWNFLGLPILPRPSDPNVRSPMELPSREEFVEFAGEACDPASVDEGDRAARMAAAAVAWRQGVVLVGGEIWVARVEPNLVIDVRTDCVTLSVATKGQYLTKEVYRFRLDRIAEATRFGERVAASEGVTFASRAGSLVLGDCSRLAYDEVVGIASELAAKVGGALREGFPPSAERVDLEAVAWSKSDFSREAAVAFLSTPGLRKTLAEEVTQGATDWCLRSLDQWEAVGDRYADDDAEASLVAAFG